MHSSGLLALALALALSLALSLALLLLLLDDVLLLAAQPSSSTRPSLWARDASYGSTQSPPDCMMPAENKCAERAAER